ncbi:MAG: hypothetical protein ACOVOW_01450, partial [Spirosomataceae bacterium]
MSLDRYTQGYCTCCRVDRASPYPDVCRPFRAIVLVAFCTLLPSCLIAMLIGLHPILMCVAPSGL